LDKTGGVVLENWTTGMPGFRSEPNKRTKFLIVKLLMKLGMKNPYLQDKVQLSPLQLKEKALDMRSIRSQFDYYVSKMQYLIDDLDNLWQNDIQSSFIDEFEGMRGQLKDFSNLADEYATLLELAAQELETSSVDMDKASVLSKGTDGPVNIVLSNIPYLKRSRIDLKAYDPYYESTQVGVPTDVRASRKNADYIYNVYDDHIELVKYVGLKRSVDIPREIDGLPVTHIGLDCFALAWRVRFVSITIPDTVTTIYHGAFRGCQHIKDVKLPDSLTYIGNYAFAFLTDLQQIEIPEGVMSIGMGAFRNCDSLLSAKIPESTLRIGNDCFYRCKNLECVDIGNSVVNIDGWAFRMCEHLSSVTIGKSVVNIGASVFYDCMMLMELSVPDQVEEIGDAAFYHRRGMTLDVSEGSAAECYARENKVKYVLRQ
jgi:uncharacterized protein YukE